MHQWPASSTQNWSQHPWCLSRPHLRLLKNLYSPRLPRQLLWFLRLVQNLHHSLLSAGSLPAWKVFLRRSSHLICYLVSDVNRKPKRFQELNRVSGPKCRSLTRALTSAATTSRRKSITATGTSIPRIFVAWFSTQNPGRYRSSTQRRRTYLHRQ